MGYSQVIHLEDGRLLGLVGRHRLVDVVLDVEHVDQPKVDLREVRGITFTRANSSSDRITPTELSAVSVIN